MVEVASVDLRCLMSCVGVGGAAMNGAMGQVRPALMEHLKDLHLPTVRGCYEETARRAEKETLSYEQYCWSFSARMRAAARKRIGKLLKESELPLEKSLPNFDISACRRRRAADEDAAGRRVSGPEREFLVFGNPGSGKSHLLTAMAQELVVVRGRKMHFTKCALLMQDLLAAKRDLRLSGRSTAGATTVSSSTIWATCSRAGTTWK